MTSSNNDIVIDESGQIINDDQGSHQDNFKKEDVATSIKELENQGISIVKDGKNEPSFTENQNLPPLDDPSHDFFKEEGIEILTDTEE